MNFVRSLYKSIMLLSMFQCYGDSRLTRDIVIDIDTTLTTCCAAIQNDFNNTWTILGAATCDATIVTTPHIIASPGYYCLANDLVGTLTITASNVTVDLNNHTVSAPGTLGILINGATNVILKNGKIVTAAIGVSLDNTNNTMIDSLIISDCTDTGILGSSCTLTHIKNCLLSNLDQFGIHFMLTNTSANLENVSIFNALSPIAFDSLFEGNFENCALDTVGSDAAFTTLGFSITNGTNIRLSNCSIKNLVSANNAFGFAFSQSSNIIMSQCSVQDLFAGVATFGSAGFAVNFDSLTAHVTLEDCILQNILAGSTSTGFQLGANDMVLNNCLVQTCSSLIGSLPNVGFALAGDQINLNNCQAYGCTQGFAVTIPNAELEYCEGSFNFSDGFILSNINPVIGNCVSTHNGDRGFNVTVVGTIPMYSCFASKNPINYVNCPNVSSAAGAGAFNNSFI